MHRNALYNSFAHPEPKNSVIFDEKRDTYLSVSVANLGVSRTLRTLSRFSSLLNAKIMQEGRRRLGEFVRRVSFPKEGVNGEKFAKQLKGN